MPLQTQAERDQEARAQLAREQNQPKVGTARPDLLAKVDAYANAAAGSTEEAAALAALRAAVSNPAG